MDLYAPALDIAQAVRRKEVSPVELLDACLERVEQVNPALNAVIWRNDDEARTEAAAWADRIAADTGDLPPFAGVPLPVKDLAPVVGWPLTYGSYGASDKLGDADELTVAALRRAGFVLTGRTNTAEFGLMPVTENVRYGATRNPWDLDRTPGGSSGGAAAAVVAGMFPVAHGSDGGGSIRIPAACCGLVGLKPSRGRVPTHIPHWNGIAVEGALCRTVADAAALLDCMSGPDPQGWFQAPPPTRLFGAEAGADPGRLRIALNLTSALGLPVCEAAAAAVHSAGALLEQAGHHLQPIDHDVIDVGIVGPFLSILHSGVADFDDVDWEKVEPASAATLAAGLAVDSVTLARSWVEIYKLMRATLEHWGRDFDLLLTPALTIEPPPAGQVLEAALAQPDAMPVEVLELGAFMAAANVSGQPAITLPVQLSEAGVPTGVHLVGPMFDEARLIRVAAQLQEAAGFVGTRPSLAS